MCGGFVGDILDAGGDLLGDAVDFVGDTVEGVGNTVGSFVEDPLGFTENLVQNALDNPLKTAATVAAAYFAPSALAELGFADAAAASEFMAADAANLAAQGIGQEQIASILGQSYSIPAELAATIAEGAGGAISEGGLDVLQQYGDQPGDYDLSGSYGNPTAPGVSEAVQDLLKYNSDYAGGALLTAQDAKKAYDAIKTANSVANTVNGVTGALTGGTGALAGAGALGGLTAGTIPSGAGTSGTIPETRLDLTPHTTKGSQISLVGMPDFNPTYTQTAQAIAPQTNLEDVQFAQGGLIRGFAEGGAPVSLDPRMSRNRKISGSTFYGNLYPTASAQVGMPSFKGYNEGGEVADHYPNFFSEGGLGSLENRYVKGEGDGTSDSVPAMLANGEFVIPADVVSKLGNGSNDAGAGVLDKFLVSVREHAQNHNPSKLPPDSKGPLAYLLEAKKKKA